MSAEPLQALRPAVAVAGQPPLTAAAGRPLPGTLPRRQLVVGRQQQVIGGKVNKLDWHKGADIKTVQSEEEGEEWGAAICKRFESLVGRAHSGAAHGAGALPLKPLPAAV